MPVGPFCYGGSLCVVDIESLNVSGPGLCGWGLPLDLLGIDFTARGWLYCGYRRSLSQGVKFTPRWVQHLWICVLGVLSVSVGCSLCLLDIVLGIVCH
jgi:hypothetical protein